MIKKRIYIWYVSLPNRYKLQNFAFQDEGNSRAKEIKQGIDILVMKYSISLPGNLICFLIESLLKIFALFFKRFSMCCTKYCKHIFTL